MRFLLLEDGGLFLLESGAFLILEPLEKRYSIIDLTANFSAVIDG